MEALTPWHLLLIILGFVLLFGYKKLPDASRSLGRSLRIFKSEVRELSESNSDAAREVGPDRETATGAGSAAAASADDLEEQAREAEAEAAQLRARARAVQGPPAS